MSTANTQWASQANGSLAWTAIAFNKIDQCFFVSWEPSIVACSMLIAVAILNLHSHTGAA